MWRDQTRQQASFWKDACAIHVKSNKQGAASEGTQEPFAPTYLVDAVPQRIMKSEKAALYSTNLLQIFSCEMCIT